MLKVVNFLTRKTMGQEMSPTAILAHAPGFLLPSLFTIPLVDGKSEIDGRLRLLATELAAHVNGCEWCMDFGRANAIKRGIPVEKLDQLETYATSDLFSPRERAALALTESVTRQVHVPDDVWQTARAHFSDRELVELVVAVSMENFYNRVNGAFALESQGFCAVPSAPALGVAA